MANDERIIKNGEVIKKTELLKETFKTGEKVWISNEDYNSEFRITETRIDNGTQFVRMNDSQNDIVVEMRYLQQAFAMGKLRRLDKQGNFIDENN